MPQTEYQLDYGSVGSTDDENVSFNYSVNGESMSGSADCQQGLLNGLIPANANQAHLLNSVCHVRYSD